MLPFLEPFLMWTLHPFFIVISTTDRQKSQLSPVAFDAKGEESTGKVEEAPAKPVALPELVLSGMIFSAMGTGFWVALHWALCWLMGKPFVLHAFMRGRGGMIDLFPYLFSGIALLSTRAIAGMREGSALKGLLLLLKMLGFLISMYVLIVNYLYWWKC
jgi:hypothetical protein